MSASIAFQTVFSDDDYSSSPSQPGCYVLTDHSILCGAYTNGAPGNFVFFRSTDDGQSWAQISTLPPMEHTYQARLVTLPDNILIFPTSDEANNVGAIYRSTNGGVSWSSVASVPFFSGAGQPHGAYGCTGFQRSGALVGGNFGGSPDTANLCQFARSTDFGATWDAELNTSVDGSGSWVNACATGGGGVMACGVAAIFSVDVPVRIFLSTDYGVTWDSGHALPTVGTPNAYRINAITYVTPSILLAAGRLGGNSTSVRTPLWRSTDAGQNWTQISAGDIADWSVPSAEREIDEVRRLTRDLCVFGWGRSFAEGTPPWRFSADAGATWNVPTTTDAAWGSLDGKTSGSIVVTPRGKILIPTIADNELRIFRGTYTC